MRIKTDTEKKLDGHLCLCIEALQKIEDIRSAKQARCIAQTVLDELRADMRDDEDEKSN